MPDLFAQFESVIRALDVMADIRKTSRTGNIAQPNVGPLGKNVSLPNVGVGPLPKQQLNMGTIYTPNNNNKMQPQGKHTDDLARGINGMNLQPPGFPNVARQTTQFPPPNAPVSGGVSMNNHMANPMPFMFNGSLGYPGNMYMQQQNPMAFHAPAGPSYNPGSYYGYGGHYSEYSPTNFVPSSRNTSGDVPSLVAPRRGSSSSNEHDLPGTPFNHYPSFANNIAIMDNSPNSLYAYSTPSPIQARFGMSKPMTPPQIPVNLQLLCQQHPAIPRAVPAPYSPQKPLEQRLVNKHGITNVYLRGLQPDTTDEMLYKLAVRFGDIDSSKAIIDHETGSCKGFGFVKYYNFKDAENCIRGFTWCGYETSFARESFYSQLKKLSEPQNTNLYISNLPKNFNEHELASIFNGYKVQSARILRTTDGSGRGVGFARFESREVCEAVIRDFNNAPVGKPDIGEYVIQIRYADTPEQKALKQSTAAARQYRTAEYESQTKPSGYGQYMDGLEHEYDRASPAKDAHGRLSALASHLSPVSNGTAVHVNLPYRMRGDSSTQDDSTDGAEPTITASMTAAGTHEKSVHIESIA